jgi:hypothetical protein
MMICTPIAPFLPFQILSSIPTLGLYTVIFQRGQREKLTFLRQQNLQISWEWQINYAVLSSSCQASCLKLWIKVTKINRMWSH